MAECIVGDIAPADNIPKEEKHRREEVGADLQKTVRKIYRWSEENSLSLLENGEDRRRCSWSLRAKVLPWSSPYDRQLAESVQSVGLNSLGLVAVVRGGLQERSVTCTVCFQKVADFSKQGLLGPQIDFSLFSALFSIRIGLHPCSSLVWHRNK